MVVLWLGLSLMSSVSKQYVVVLWLVYCCCRQSVNTICGCIIVGFVVVVVVQLAQCMIIPILWLGLSFLSSVSKDNMWLYYGLVCCCFCPSVSTICGRIMVGFVIVVSQ